MNRIIAVVHGLTLEQVKTLVSRFPSSSTVTCYEVSKEEIFTLAKEKKGEWSGAKVEKG